MTEAEIRTTLRRLTAPQRRLLAAMVAGQTPSLSLERIRTLDVLVRHKLVIGSWEDERHLRLHYEPPTLVATVARQLWGLDTQEEPTCSTALP